MDFDRAAQIARQYIDRILAAKCLRGQSRMRAGCAAKRFVINLNIPALRPGVPRSRASCAKHADELDRYHATRARRPQYFWLEGDFDDKVHQTQTDSKPPRRHVDAHAAAYST